MTYSWGLRLIGRRVYLDSDRTMIAHSPFEPAEWSEICSWGFGVWRLTMIEHAAILLTKMLTNAH